jgi:glyoxylase-like metal-dependent hydrolase (beta-lactamase superfamily II)
MNATALASVLAAAVVAGGPFTIETLAPGVDLYRGDPARGCANSLVVERADGLAVVDAQPSPAAAAELLAAIGARTKKPVRYLMFSHPHVEAIGGASAFPASAVRIGSRGCAEALRNPEIDFAAEARARAADPAGYPAPPALAPALTLDGTATLEDPALRIEMFPMPPADTVGGLLVVLPEQGIAFVGDLLAWERNPFAEHATIEGWIARINAVATMAPKVVVPSRGPTEEVVALRRQRDSFVWLRAQVSKAFVDLVPVEDIPKRVRAHEDFAKWFDTTAVPSFVPGVIDAVVREAVAERRRRGLP